MRAPTLSIELPPGHEVVRSARALLVQRVDAADVLRAAGFGPDSDGRLTQSSLSGRKPLFEIAVPGQALLVRRFSHGGLLRALTGSRFRDPMRPFRELALSSALHARGIATPEVVAARAQALSTGGFQLDLVTRRVPETRDLGFVLALARSREIDPHVIRGLAVALGDLVRRLHDGGVLHADLTLNNVLADDSVLRGGGAKLWILDLDRAVVTTALTDVQRRRNLERLFRFVERRERRDGRTLERTDFVRFFRGYDPTRRRWKADWRAIVAIHASHRAVHALGWWMERLFGRTRDPRDRVRRATSP